MKKKDVSFLLWLLLIPCQLIVSFLFVRLGIWIDLALFTNVEAKGHGMPVFSAIFFLTAAVITAIVFVLSLILTIRGFRRQCRKRKGRMNCD